MLKLLPKSEELFDGTIVTRKTDPVEFRLKYDAKAICSQPYLVPKVHEKMFKKDAGQLFLLGLLEVAND